MGSEFLKHETINCQSIGTVFDVFRFKYWKFALLISMLSLVLASRATLHRASSESSSKKVSDPLIFHHPRPLKGSHLHEFHIYALSRTVWTVIDNGSLHLKHIEFTSHFPRRVSCVTPSCFWLESAACFTELSTQPKWTRHFLKIQSQFV